MSCNPTNFEKCCFKQPINHKQVGSSPLASQHQLHPGLRVAQLPLKALDPLPFCGELPVGPRAQILQRSLLVMQPNANHETNPCILCRMPLDQRKPSNQYPQLFKRITWITITNAKFNSLSQVLQGCLTSASLKLSFESWYLRCSSTILTSIRCNQKAAKMNLHKNHLWFLVLVYVSLEIEMITVWNFFQSLGNPKLLVPDPSLSAAPCEKSHDNSQVRQTVWYLRMRYSSGMIHAIITET